MAQGRRLPEVPGLRANAIPGRRHAHDRPGNVR